MCGCEAIVQTALVLIERLHPFMGRVPFPVELAEVSLARNAPLNGYQDDAGSQGKDNEDHPDESRSNVFNEKWHQGKLRLLSS